MRSVTRIRRRFLQKMVFAVAVVGLVVGLPTRRCAAEGEPPKIRAAIDKGVAFLRTELGKQRGEGGSLGAYAMLKGDAPRNDPAVMRQVAIVRAKVGKDGKYKAGSIYVAGCDVMLLEAAQKKGARTYFREIQAIATYIISQHHSEGYWSYGLKDKDGDTSVTQYGALGLWAAARAGVKVPPQTWQKMAKWLISTQTKGGWMYRPKQGVQGGDISLGLAAAGVSSLYISALYLYPDKMAAISKQDAADRKKKKKKKTDARVKTVDIDTAEEEKNAAQNNGGDFKPTVAFEAIRGSATRGLAYANMAANQGIVIGRWPLYTAYGVERMGGLSGRKKIGKGDWYANGSAQLLKSQASDGSWKGQLVEKTVGTAFGVLFLSRATLKILGIAPTFGGGILVGNDKLPDFSELGQNADGTVTKKEQVVGDAADLISIMLSRLDDIQVKGVRKKDPAADKRIEMASQQIVKLIQQSRGKALEEWRGAGRRRQLLLMADHPKPLVRQLGVWALGRTGNLDTVTLMMNALESDPDLSVAIEARNAMCWIARKPRGFGLLADPRLVLLPNLAGVEKDVTRSKWNSDKVWRNEQRTADVEEWNKLQRAADLVKWKEEQTPADLRKWNEAQESVRFEKWRKEQDMDFYEDWREKNVDADYKKFRETKDLADAMKWRAKQDIVDHKAYKVSRTENDPVVYEVYLEDCKTDGIKPKAFDGWREPILPIKEWRESVAIEKWRKNAYYVKWREDAVKHWKTWYFESRPYSERDDLKERPNVNKG